MGGRSPTDRWGSRQVRDVYRRLNRRFGPAGWWPGESAFEVAAGAVLTQNTAWRNAERALAGLREAGLLEVGALGRLPEADLAARIRASGTYRVKARRLKALVAFLESECAGRVRALAEWPAGSARARLLAVHGIGPETADAILVYAAGVPTFVADAYARRVFARLGALDGREGYEAVRRWFLERLPADADLLGDYHAQLVRLGKQHCRTRPLCPGCPLQPVCRHGGGKGD